MKEEIYKLIADLKSVSFVNLSDQIEGFKGELAMVGKGNPHLIFWWGVSQEGIDALSELMVEKRIKMKGTSHLTYLIDGCALTFPLVKRNIKYKTDHWCPVVFDVM